MWVTDRPRDQATERPTDRVADGPGPWEALASKDSKNYEQCTFKLQAMRSDIIGKCFLCIHFFLLHQYVLLWNLFLVVSQVLSGCTMVRIIIKLLRFQELFRIYFLSWVVLICSKQNRWSHRNKILFNQFKDAFSEHVIFQSKIPINFKKWPHGGSSQSVA